MWLWILSALFLALVWAVWFILRPTGAGPNVESFPPTWIPIAITVVVVLALVGTLVWRRLRAARAARALEKAIAQQAQEQALNARPEKRAEIQELSSQIQAGINALKASKLGGGRRGSSALYTLPWYVMVGPPGVGKTTALRHSGLVFPYLDPAGGGVKGVGGTRNCDWWFTNEAILLDTAGRYTTEAEDHDEWMAFLEQLHKHRSHKPLNGIILAVSIHELLDSSDEQIEQMGRKLRARIDEMQNTLRMVLPVYVFFTKADLVAGFSEFFSDLKRSERAAPWGATLELRADKADPAALFEREFDLLVERLHHRGIRRLATERAKDTKEKIYQFPLEFAAIKRNLSDLMAAAFSPQSGTQPTPILRGFYFTSGTQEGTPMDRVVGAMGRAFGLRPVQIDDPATRVESKSYFLRDVFTTIVFPDQEVAARTEVEARRQRLQRFAAAAAAFTLAMIFLIPAIVAYSNNRALVAQTASVSTEAANVNWADGRPAPEKVQKLDRLRDHVMRLDQWKQEGAPVSYRWFMYQGDKLLEPSLAQYLQSLDQGFVRPSKARLEEKLRGATGAKYLEDYYNLKTYLLLDDKVHLQDEAEWEKARLTQVWADVLRPTSDLSEADLKARLWPHVSYWVDLLRRGVIQPPPVDRPLIERTRDVLARVGSSQRYYDQFVTVLVDQKYDEGGPATRDNLKYPPVTLQDMFSDRPEVLTKLHSARKEREGKWFEVQGPYTEKGHAQVLASLKEGTKLLEREKWVVPLSAEEKQQGDKIQQALERVRQDYDGEYIRQWVGFFRDIQVDVPPNNKEAIAEFRILSTPDWPYLRLLRTLHDATQFDELKEPESQVSADGGVIDQIKEKVTRRVESKTKIRVGQFVPGQKGERYDPVPPKFESMVRFAVPPPTPPPAEGQPEPPPPQTGLSKYVALLEQLTGEMGNIEDGPLNANTAKVTETFEAAVKETQALLLGMDETGQELMTPLLMNPLKQAYRAVVRGAGGAASGLWEVAVWPSYRDGIKNRYPFNLAASKDASFDDAVAFFKPKDGVLWGFYEENLKGFHSKVGHDFVPRAHLEARPRPARPSSPFNANLYNCLRRADEITDALFAQGGDKPKVVFKINMKTVSPIVSEVIFEVDGQRRLYRNEKEFEHTFTWPGEKAPGARIQVRGAGGLDEEIVRDGPWGIFRLFEAGQVTAEKEKDDRFTVTWQMTAPPVTVTMEVKPTRGNHPFSPSFFRATNCPSTIGDRLGKG